jgi:hypothetical protein
VGWVIAQVATQIFPFLEIPNWIVRLVIVLIAIGFPIALIIGDEARFRAVPVKLSLPYARAAAPNP